jgi:hypothetical protein
LPCLNLRAISLLTLMLVPAFASCSAGAGSAVGSPATSVLSVGNSATTHEIPSGFVGLSMEIPSVLSSAGNDPRRIDSVLVQLIRNLTPGQRPVLRLGGDSTDWTWWPIGGMVRPLGVRYTLTPRWLAVTRALAAAADARLIVGIDFEVDSRRVASAEARAVVRGIGQRWIEALELGNEPELYSGIAWFAKDGVKVFGRTRGYDFDRYLPDYTHIAASLPHVPLAGPSTGAPTWMRELGRFAATEPRVRVLTVHAYPLKHCSPLASVTIDELLSPDSTRGLANGVAGSAAIAHAHGLALRVDEMNAVTCGGQTGVSDTFASALWVLDALFEMARVGVDGVNIHTRTSSSGRLFSFRRVYGRWQASVRPEYYGMMMFAQAAPAGSRLLPVAGATNDTLRAWATSGPDGHLRVVLINTDTRLDQLVVVHARTARGAGTIERLRAPSAAATGEVSLGGQSFGSRTSTGRLAGRPQLSSVAPQAGGYAVEVPPAGAAMLTLSSNQS